MYTLTTNTGATYTARTQFGAYDMAQALLDDGALRIEITERGYHVRTYELKSPRPVAELLAWAADPSVLETADALLQADTHRWIQDPDIDGVWALIRKADRKHNTADLIVYLEAEDFETSASFAA